MSGYKCHICNYNGDEPGDKICETCLGDFPDQGDHGAPAMCDCGSEKFDVACPRCGELMTESDFYDIAQLPDDEALFDAEG